MRTILAPVAKGTNPLEEGISESTGPNFLTRDAHRAVYTALRTIAKTHTNGSEIDEILLQRTVGGAAREDKIVRALELIGEDPADVAKLLDASRRDIKAGRNGDQMLRYVVNMSYKENEGGEMFYSDPAVQRAVARVIRDGATDAPTLQKFLGLLESDLSPKSLGEALQKPFSTASIYELVTANADRANEQIEAYLHSETRNKTAAAMIAYHRDPSNSQAAKELESAFRLSPQAGVRLNKALGLDENAAPVEAVKALITFSPDASKPDDVTKSVAVLQGALHAMRFDPEHGQTLYEVAVTKLYNPNLEEGQLQVWKQPAVQRQFAKSLVALARIGKRTKDMTPLAKTLTWYEGTLTAPQVGALLKQDLDPTIVHEMLISGNIDLTRTRKDRTTGEVRHTHVDKLNEFLNRVDSLGDQATENQKKSAALVRRALSGANE